MTLQAKILPWSFCGPSHIPPLLLSSSKGLREKKVDFDGCFVSWDVFALERKHHKVHFPPYSTSVAEYNCKHCKVQQDFYGEEDGTAKGTLWPLSSFIRSLAMDGTCTATTLQRLQHPFFKTSQLLILLIQSGFGTFLSRNDEPFGLVLAFEFHVRRSEIVRKLESLNRLATNFSEPSQGGFFDVLTARNSLEKKS